MYGTVDTNGSVTSGGGVKNVTNKRGLINGPVLLDAFELGFCRAILL